MAGTVENIRVVMSMITKNFNRGMNQAQRGVKSLGTNMHHFGNVIAAPLDKMHKMDSSFTDIKHSGGKAALGIRRFTQGLKGFRMELLGVMFFGMMLSGMLMGLMRPALDAFGVFELWGVMLMMVFIPAVEMIFPLLLWIMEGFMNLSEPMKKTIGLFTMLGIIVFTALFIIGSFGLGIGALISLYGGKVGAMLIGAGKALVASAGAITTIALAVLVVIYGIYLAWKENFLNIRSFMDMFWDGLKGVFKGALDILLGIIDFFVALFTGDFEGMKLAIKRILNGLLSVLYGFVKMFIGFWFTLAIGVAKIVWGIIQTAFNLGVSIGKALRELFEGLFPKVYKWGIDLTKSIADGIISVASLVKDAILGLFPSWARAAIWKLGSFTIGIFTKSSGGGTPESIPHGDDFIWRSGSGMATINPNDTVVGYKGESPLGGSAGGETTINNYFNGFSNDDLQRELDERDEKLVNELQRLVKQ